MNPLFRIPKPTHCTLLAALFTATALPSHADLIVYEPFDYTISSNNPDPDGGLNSGNGLPATNVGGNPSGTSTGLRNNWGTSLDVAAGLNYPGFPVTGGAGQINNATWGTGAINPYRFMTTDPFISYRTDATNSGSFGADGTTLYFSMLMKLNNNFGSGTIARFVIGAAETSGNTYIGANLNDSTTTFNWGISRGSNGTYSSTGVAAAPGETALLVGRYTFGAGNVDTVELWVNPTLGQPLGTAQASITGGDFAITGFNTRPDTANVFVIDEFRIGTTEADVLPSGAPDTTAPDWISGFPNSSLPTTDGFTLNAKTNESGTVYYVVLPNGAPQPSNAQVKAGQNSSGSPVSPSGSFAVTANLTNSAAITGLSAATDYDVYLVAEDSSANLQATSILVNAATESASGTLIIDEGFDYTVSSNNPDPDGGVNSGNGLPATNDGGNPAGTSTGIRGNWGTTLDVAAGLTYTGLLTSGGAGAPNNATWGTGAINPYRFMTTDPYLAYREGNVNNGAFGADGKTLYLSMLMKLGDSFDSTNIARVAIGGTEGNIYVGANLGDNDTTPNWGISRGSTGTTVNSTVDAAAGDTALLVLRYTFGASNSDTIELWVNPTVGQPLGVPQATLSGGNFAITGFNTRPDTTGAFVFDELRMGTALAAVLPQDNPPANNYTSWASTNGVTGGVGGDSDNDGVTNGMEYALQTNLTGSNGSLGTYTGGTLSFTKRPDAVNNGDVTYVIETSPNLSPPWTPQVTHNPGNTDASISYALPTGQGKIFARLRVEIAP